MPTTSATAVRNRPTVAPCSRRDRRHAAGCGRDPAAAGAGGRPVLPGRRPSAEPGGRTIIAATHQNLEKRVSDGEFREDLFHRSQRHPGITSRPLKERRRISPSWPATSCRAAMSSTEAKSLHPDTQTHISRLPWPGQRAPAGERLPLAHRDGLGQEVLVSDLPTELLTPHHHHGRARPACTAWRLAAAARTGWPPSWHWGDRHPWRMPCPSSSGSCWRRRWNHPWSLGQEAARLLGWGCTPRDPQAQGADIPESTGKRFPSRLRESLDQSDPVCLKTGVSFRAPCLEWQAFQPDSQKVPHD